MRLLLVAIFALFLNQSVLADQATDCFNKAWAHPDDGGLGLTKGQAIAICNGATNVNEIVKCYKKAWGHPEDGGHGLNRGQAIELCASVKER